MQQGNMHKIQERTIKASPIIAMYCACENDDNNNNGGRASPARIYN